MTILVYAPDDGQVEASGLNGYGIRGADVPSTGGSGAAVIYDSLSLPADNDKEYRFEVTSLPSAGTLVLNEDTTCSFTGAPDGTYYLVGDLLEYDPATGDVTDKGEITVTFIIGLTAVTADLAQSFAVVNTVQTDLAETFSIVASVQVDCAETFAVLNALQADLSQTFSVISAVQTDLAETFSVLNDVQVDLVQTFGIQNAVQADLSQSFNVHGVVQADLSQSFNVHGVVQADLDQSFDVDAGNSVSATLSQTFSVLNFVQADLAQSFGVHGAVQADLAQSFDVFNVVQTDQAETFSIVGSVQADLAQAFGVSSSVERDLAQTFVVFSGSGGGTGASAAEIWAHVVEGGMSAEQMLRVIMAAVSGTTSGVGTLQERYMSRDGSKPRITADFDSNSNRIAVTVDGT